MTHPQQAKLNRLRTALKWTLAIWLAVILAIVASVASAAEQPPANALLADLNARQLANIPATAASITITPESAEAYDPVTATLDTEIPIGARVLGNGWTFSKGVKVLPVSATVLHVWAPPGKHTIRYDGVWFHTKTIAIVDKEGNDQTIESLLGIGMIDSAASFTVGGEPQPDPKPDPPPPTPGPLAEMWVIVVEESSDRTPAQAQVLFTYSLPNWLARNGHHFRLVDRDQPAEDLSAWIAQAEQHDLPRLFLVGEDGEAVYEGPLPETIAEMMALVKKWGTEK
jgi:hypothetical protein